MYIGHHEKVLRSCCLYFESELDVNSSPKVGVPAMESGSVSTHNEKPNNLPVTISWVSMPYTKRAQFKTAPVHIEFHEGGWQEGKKIYRKWYNQFFEFDHCQNWLRREHAWNTINLMTSEGQVLYPYDEIPDMAIQAKKYGVNVLHIYGWWKGGHDRNYPFYEPEPRLGGEKTLRKAIAKCHELGVQVVLFANLQWVDAGTDWFRREGYRYIRMHPSGSCRYPVSYGHGTATASCQFIAPMLVETSPAFTEFQKLIEEQIVNIARLGADGVNLDKMNTMGGLCFNPDHGQAPDVAFSQVMLDSLEEIRRKCSEINPDFGIAAECPLDRLMPLIDLTYIRFPVKHKPYMRTIFPKWTGTICITGSGVNAFDEINMAVRCGYFISVEFPQLRRGFGDSRFEALSNYTAEVLRIRRKLEDIIYFGEFLNTEGAHVDNITDEVLYGVFRNPANNDYACVVHNFGNEPVTVNVSFDCGEGAWTIYTPFEEERVVIENNSVTINQHSFSIVVTAKGKNQQNKMRR